MGDRLAKIDMGLKVGSCCAPFRWGKLGPPLTQCRLGRGLIVTWAEAYLRIKWNLDTIDMGRKLRCCCAPFGRAGYPSNTIRPGLRPISVSSGILIHPAVWPQETWTENWGLCPFWRGGAGSQKTEQGTAQKTLRVTVRAVGE